MWLYIKMSQQNRILLIANYWIKIFTLSPFKSKTFKNTIIFIFLSINKNIVAYVSIELESLRISNTFNLIPILKFSLSLAVINMILLYMDDPHYSLHNPKLSSMALSIQSQQFNPILECLLIKSLSPILVLFWEHLKWILHPVHVLLSIRV